MSGVAILTTSDEMRVVSSGIVPQTLYFPRLPGSLTGTCREVLSTIGLPSGWLRLMIVSRTRKNFSASMCVASFVGFARKIAGMTASKRDRAHTAAGMSITGRLVGAERRRSHRHHNP
jgi:hypothetical protein